MVWSRSTYLLRPIVDELAPTLSGDVEGALFANPTTDDTPELSGRTQGLTITGVTFNGTALGAPTITGDTWQANVTTSTTPGTYDVVIAYLDADGAAQTVTRTLTIRPIGSFTSGFSSGFKVA